MKFTEKTQAEFEALNEIEKAQYLTELTKFELLKVSNENKVRFDELTQKLAENEANLKGVQESIKNLGTAKKEDKEVDNIEVLKKGFETLTKKPIQLKATTTQNAITDRTMNYIIGEVHRTPMPKFVFTDFFPTIRVTDPNSFDELSYMDYDEVSITRAAAARTETGAVAESNLVLIEKVVRLESIADSYTLTKAAQRRGEIFARDINMFLENNMKLAINSALYSGDGNSPNINGLYTQVTAFNHGAYTGQKFIGANLSDLLLVLKTQILKGKDQNYMPDFAFVSHEDYMALTGLKNVNSEYISAPTHGITLIPSSFVTTNTLVIGCSDLVKLYTTLEYDFEIGYKSGNFEKRMPSVLVESLYQLLIRFADLGGFLKVTSASAAITAITA